MGRHKVDYGIDLGTTNSAIARMDNGKAKVIKSDDRQMDTTPSCVYYNKNRTVFVGMKAANLLSRDAAKMYSEFRRTGNIQEQAKPFAEFKREMGTEAQFFSTHMNRSYSPEELSAEVLKKLKSYISDEQVNASIITIPMRFEQFQVDATRRAAQLAGFQYIETLQEPIAAASAYGLEPRSSQGYWLVFDLGGGTFDVALIRVIDGIMKVVDNAGDTKLGGRDIDYAIVDRIIIPAIAQQYNIKRILDNNQGKQLFRDALKWIAEEAKIYISKNTKGIMASDEPLDVDDDGKEIELSINMTLDDYRGAAVPIYQRAIDITKDLIERNKLRIPDIQSFILVGGPTYSQTLRAMLRDQLGDNIDYSVDPMTVVAQGAALYASTRDIPTSFQRRDKTKIQITLNYAATTVEPEENLAIKIERAQTIGDVPERVFAEVTRSDKGWSSGRVEIEEDREIIPLHLKTGESNEFSIRLFDDKGNNYECEPSAITIIQGMKAASQIIPLTFCVEAVIAEIGKQLIIPIKGLERNQSLPARGRSEALKTQIDIRPGNPQDIIKIPIYAGEPYTKAIHNNLAGIAVLTGESFDHLIARGSNVEISIDVDETQKIAKVYADFPDIDEMDGSILADFQPWKQSQADPAEIEREVRNAENKVAMLEEEYREASGGKIEKLKRDVAELSSIFEHGRGNDDDEVRVGQRLREVWKELDKLEQEAELPRLKEQLSGAIKSLLLTNHRYGNQQTGKVTDDMQRRAKLAIDEKDAKIVQGLLDDIQGFEFAILMEDMGFLVGYIKYYDENFAKIEWSNSIEAKKLLNEAKRIIALEPSKNGLQNILARIFNLLPPGTKAYEEMLSREILEVYR